MNVQAFSQQFPLAGTQRGTIGTPGVVFRIAGIQMTFDNTTGTETNVDLRIKTKGNELKLASAVKVPALTELTLLFAHGLSPSAVTAPVSGEVVMNALPTFHYQDSAEVTAVALDGTSEVRDIIVWWYPVDSGRVDR